MNQFPYETVLTVKDLLAASIQYAYKDSSLDPKTMRWPPSWFETTFNLNTELPQFVAYFQQRERRLVSHADRYLHFWGNLREKEQDKVLAGFCDVFFSWWTNEVSIGEAKEEHLTIFFAILCPYVTFKNGGHDLLFM